LAPRALKRGAAFIIAAMAAAALLGSQPAMAQSGIVSPVIVPITIETDALEYTHSATIEVNGAVKNYNERFQVTLAVISPQGNRVNIQQLEVDPETNRYSTTINTAGPLWNYDGRYTIEVQYGVGSGASNKAHVDLVGSGITNPIREAMPEEETGAMMERECAANELAVGDDCVRYTISGGSVTGASTSFAGQGGGTSMLITLDAMEPGTLTVSPDRPACTADDGYIVLVDGQEWDDYNVLTDSIAVSLNAGASSVEIIGACVVPEFGALAAVILVVAVAAAIVATGRGRAGIMPKF